MSTNLLADPVPRLDAIRKRWTIAEFARLMTDGCLEEGSRTYLWDFEIIEPLLENRPHVDAVANLLALLFERFSPRDWTVNQGAPIVPREGFKPQPDAAVLTGPRSKYRVGTPTTADIALLIEVADATYDHDVHDFLRGDAASGIPRYWIVNIPARRVEAYESPRISADGTPFHETRTDHGADQTIPRFVSRGDATVVGEIAVIDMVRDSMEEAGDDLEHREVP